MTINIINQGLLIKQLQHYLLLQITDANIPSIQEYTKAAGKSSSDNKEGDELLKRCKILTDMIGNEKTFDINLLTRV